MHELNIKISNSKVKLNSSKRLSMLHAVFIENPKLELTIIRLKIYENRRTYTYTE